MDRRTTPANGRVAAAGLQGAVEAEAFVEGVDRRMAAPLTDLLKTPDGPRDRQLLQGAAIKVFDSVDDWLFIQSVADNYVGYVPENTVGAATPVTTHFVAVPSGHAYSEPDIKSREIAPLCLNGEVAIASHMPKFYETAEGHYIPKPHLRRLENRFANPVTVAQMLFGAPYLWGGNSVAGVDCSGLVQLAHHACGMACPADSDQQEAGLGEEIALDAPVERGDLFLWKGHVALAVDSETLIHANAHHMAVAYEPIADGTRRIVAQGDGPVTSRRRVTLPL